MLKGDRGTEGRECEDLMTLSSALAVLSPSARRPCAAQGPAAVPRPRRMGDARDPSDLDTPPRGRTPRGEPARKAGRPQPATCRRHDHRSRPPSPDSRQAARRPTRAGRQRAVSNPIPHEAGFRASVDSPHPPHPPPARTPWRPATRPTRTTPERRGHRPAPEGPSPHRDRPLWPVLPTAGQILLHPRPASSGRASGRPRPPPAHRRTTPTGRTGPAPADGRSVPQDPAPLRPAYPPSRRSAARIAGHPTMPRIAGPGTGRAPPRAPRWLALPADVRAAAGPWGVR